MCKCRSHGTFPLFGLQSSHLNICYYHQDPHRRPLRPGSRPGFCSDRRALLLIGAWPLPRRPGIGRALQRHPFSGLVDSAGMLTRTLLRRSRSVDAAPLGGDRVGQLPCASRVYSPVDSHTCQTPWSVFQDGSNGEPAGQRRERAVAEARQRRALSATIGATAFRGHIDCPGFGRRLNPRWSAPRADRRTGSRRSTSDRGASPAPIRFPPDNFKHSLTLFSKSFSSFPRGTCSLSVSRPYLALDGIYRPIGAAFPNNPTRRQRLVVRQGPGTTGLSPSGAPFQGTWARSAAEDASPDYNSDSEAARFSSWAIPGAGAFGSNVTPRADDGTTARELRVQPPLVVTSVAAGIAFGPAARDGAREANLRPPAPGEGGDAMRDAQADVPWPNGFGRNLRSKTRWFTGFCNSHQVSHFATFFIDARAEISVAESRFDIRETSPPPVHPANGGLARRTLR
ncbi:UNVERIFIED_CONTAM: protein TAR1 [Sesamum latifolium]|uniref:Protein TAR1 n=1 Tax=Sesamum latifolium TaxID=2727402 RepID=A0AAW2UUX6_9LAMI